MLLIWLMTMSLMVLISKSSSRPLFTTSSLLSSLDSADLIIIKIIIILDISTMPRTRHSLIVLKASFCSLV